MLGLIDDFVILCIALSDMPARLARTGRQAALLRPDFEDLASLLLAIAVVQASGSVLIYLQIFLKALVGTDLL